MSKRRRVFIMIAALILLLTACSSGGRVMEDGDAQHSSELAGRDNEDTAGSYTQISQDEAREMMEDLLGNSDVLLTLQKED